MEQHSSTQQHTAAHTSKSRLKIGSYSKGYLGVKIYKGTTCISGAKPIEIGYWYDGQHSLKSTTWNCTEQNITDTYIKIETWCKIEGFSWETMGVEFKTYNFTENTILNATTWTIYLWGEFDITNPRRGPPGGRSYITFKWGSSSRNSRIVDMIFTQDE